MKLLPWLLALHLVAIAIASGISVHTDRDSTKLAALCLSFMIVGGITALSSFCFCVYMLAKGKAGIREVVLLLILMFIGFHEHRMATDGWAFLSALPG